MIGKITFPYGGEDVEAELGDNGKWTVHSQDEETRRHLKQVLDTLHSPYDEKYPYPAGGIFGYAAGAEASQRFGGRADFPRPPDDSKETIY